MGNINQSYDGHGATAPVTGSTGSTVSVPAVVLVDSANGQPVHPITGGSTTVAIASAKSTDTVVKASAGRLCKVLLTTANGAAAISIYDNASTHSGTVIGYIPASAAAGTLVDFQMPAAAGITVGGAATNPAMTISYY